MCAGHSPCRTVEVRIDSSGLPFAVRIDATRRQLLAARSASDRADRTQGFGLAVRSAWQAAATARACAQAGALSRGGWPAPGTSAPPVVTRPLPELVDAVIDTLHRARRPPPAAGPRLVVGRDPLGQVGVTLSPTALVACTLDEQWAAECPVAQLETATNAALRSARAALDLLDPPPPDPVDRLLAEAMTLLAAAAGGSDERR